MSRSQELARFVIDRVPDGVEAAVTVTDETSALTRFANSFIHQNVTDVGSSISLQVAKDGRVVNNVATLGDDREALERFVDNTVASVDVAPLRPDWVGVREPVDVAPIREPVTPVDPDTRAQMVKDFIDQGDGLSAAGYCDTPSGEIAFLNTQGHAAFDHTGSTVLDGIHRTDTSAGSGHAAGRTPADVDAVAVGSLAADRARRSQETTDLAPGEYEVVLSPDAVATVAIFLAFYGFNGKAVHEGQSFLKVGDRQFDDAFTLIDDATDPRTLGISFDSEGTPKRRTTLVDSGLTKAFALDRKIAAKMGLETTGNAASFFGADYGPLPLNLFVAGGDTSPDDLIAGVERGLYVSTFNYSRVLDPSTTVTTGLTRNGTFLIENGEITGAVSNLRYTQSMAGSVGPGKILGVGNDARLADSEFGPRFVHCPSLRLASWRFTGGASG